METIMLQVKRFLQDRLIVSYCVDAEQLIAYIRSIAGEHSARSVLNAARTRRWIAGPKQALAPCFGPDVGADPCTKPYFQILPAVDTDVTEVIPAEGAVDPSQAAKQRKRGRTQTPIEDDVKLLNEFKRSGLTQKEFAGEKSQRPNSGNSESQISRRLNRARKYLKLQKQIP